MENGTGIYEIIVEKELSVPYILKVETVDGPVVGLLEKSCWSRINRVTKNILVRMKKFLVPFIKVSDCVFGNSIKVVGF